MINQLIMGYISCIGFGYIFNNKPKSTFIGAIAGATGWIFYLIALRFNLGEVTSTFIGAFVIGVLCECFARIFKDATVVFMIPAILPLVPGAGLYFTMRGLIDQNMDFAFEKGINTTGCAIAITIGLLFASTIYQQITHYLKN